MTFSIQAARKLFLAAGIAGLLALNAAQATLVVTPINQVGDGINPFNPTFAPIITAADLLYQLTPSASVGTFNLEVSGGTGILNDGAFGPLSTGVSGAHPTLATTGPGAGTSLTYTLPVAKILQSVVVYGGWNDNGRDQQAFVVNYSTNGTTFTSLGSVDFNPTVATGLQSATRVTFSDTTGILAAGAVIKALRFDFTSTVENNYAGQTEIAAYAVPEPNSVALALMGGAGMLGMLRRRRA